MRRAVFAGIALTLPLALALASPRPSAFAGVGAFPGSLGRPAAAGDQAIYYFDARANRTTFLTVRNDRSDQNLVVRVLFYTGNFASPFSREFTLGPFELEIVDVGSLRDSGLPAAPGVAMAFAVDGGGSPVVTRAITGNFTVANLLTGSAWGSPAAARAALRNTGGTLSLPTIGTAIDGSSVFLPPIAPNLVDLAVYYDPESLAPVANGGNEVIFVGFTDVPGAAYTAVAATVDWTLQATRGDGTPIGGGTFTATGVEVKDLETLAGPGVNGAAGSMQFGATAVVTPTTRLVFFAEALGTFGTGYLLPTLEPAFDLCDGS